MLEFPSSWSEGMDFRFFPVFAEELSNEAIPLMLGFEDTLTFQGPNIDSEFDKIVRTPEDVFGVCFFHPQSIQVLPLAVYAKVLEKTPFEVDGQTVLNVKARVVGRVMIEAVKQKQPHIIANVTKIEDKEGLVDPETAKKIIDELMRLHDQCNEVEAELMDRFNKPFTAMNIRLRPSAQETIDTRTADMAIDPISDLQSYVQISSMLMMEHHLLTADKYDAMCMTNTEDRLRFIRDKLRQKQKELLLLKKTPQEEVEKAMKAMQEQLQALQQQQAGGAGGMGGAQGQPAEGMSGVSGPGTTADERPVSPPGAMGGPGQAGGPLI
ncbi:unnamed protein product [Vitrella brassicaformis CCMP3155]|uniref:Lon N-terminal domain-containing protein n=1 Tax=Vitrella brassicaformis (strain CCMP3155) TaxID=1169540 RepID=A0A0G4FV59_VITBC|nr:unnamed protein product [Vitrella brassicaformis CCMP3155]|eukprot:CEM18486.1 unnamed protein product [Vitrella brassicaformis CCMP3155]